MWRSVTEVADLHRPLRTLGSAIDEWIVWIRDVFLKFCKIPEQGKTISQQANRRLRRTD